MRYCVGLKLVEKLGVSKFLSQIVTLTHTANYISAKQQIGANRMDNNTTHVAWCRLPSYVVTEFKCGQSQITLCHAKTPNPLYLLFHCSRCSEILHKASCICSYDACEFW